MFAQKFHMIKVCRPCNTFARVFDPQRVFAVLSVGSCDPGPALCHVLATYQVTASCDVLRDGLSLAAQSWSFIGTSPLPLGVCTVC